MAELHGGYHWPALKRCNLSHRKTFLLLFWCRVTPWGIFGSARTRPCNLVPRATPHPTRPYPSTSCSRSFVWMLWKRSLLSPRGGSMPRRLLWDAVKCPRFCSQTDFRVPPQTITIVWARVPSCRCRDAALWGVGTATQLGVVGDISRFSAGGVCSGARGGKTGMRERVGRPCGTLPCGLVPHTLPIVCTCSGQNMDVQVMSLCLSTPIVPLFHGVQSTTQLSVMRMLTSACWLVSEHVNETNAQNDR